MIDDVEAVHFAEQLRHTRIRHTRLHEFRLLRHVGFAAGRQVVEHPNAVAPGDVCICNVAGYEAGATGYENLSRCHFSPGHVGQVKTEQPIKDTGALRRPSILLLLDWKSGGYFATLTTRAGRSFASTAFVRRVTRTVAVLSVT